MPAIGTDVAAQLAAPFSQAEQQLAGVGSQFSQAVGGIDFGVANVPDLSKIISGIGSNPLDAFGGVGAAIGGANPLDAFGGVGPTVGAAADAAATGAQTGTEPCLPNNPPVTNAGGSGATPPASESYPDAILRQARAAAASPASIIPNPLAAFGGAGPVITSSPSGAAANALDAFGGAGPAVATTAPTTVTQQPSTPTAGQSTTPTNSSANVYIYEPLEGGFDRYDFNSGKKVFTPNSGGSSMNAAGNTVTPTSTPIVATPLDGGIAVGTTTGGASKLRQRVEAAAAGRTLGPQ